MKECKVVYIDCSYELESKNGKKIDEINACIAEWLSKGWQVLSVTPFTSGTVIGYVNVLITFFR